ncbi:MAG TPA: DUF92 domain-containing protein [Vicinamibacteria bacterium]
MGLTRSELLRKLVHVGCGSFAFLLRDLTTVQAAGMAVAAFVFNWQVLPRIGGRSLWRSDEHAQGYPRGILLYPLAVLAVILYFASAPWMAAALWGVLAFGDGMASFVGQALRGPRLPWNRDKGWSGLLAFVAFGTLGAALLMAWTSRLPLEAGAWHWPRTLGVALALNLVCALVESLPTTLDDNLTVPLAGALTLPLLAQADLALAASDPNLASRALLGLGLNLAVALAALFAGSIDLGGAVSAVLIGTVITAGLGVGGFAVMVAFFVLGSLATRLGYRVKAARGIAQEKGGARGWRNAWANGGVPAFLAALAGTTAVPLHDLLVLAYAASVATAAADTCSSEVGKAYGRRTFLITSLRPVPPGTEGAVSLEGTLGGLLGGLVVAFTGTAFGLYGTRAALLVGLAGLVGSLAESVLGTVAEKRGWMGNDLLNATNTAIGALVVCLLVRVVG